MLSLVLTVSLKNNTNAHSQENNLSPEKFFDFWVGNWSLTWEDETFENGMAKGTNKIEKVLEGKVIKENFKANSGTYKRIRCEKLLGIQYKYRRMETNLDR